MIGTSSTRAGRIWKFSAVFTPVLTLHDTPKGATAVVAGIDDPGPHAIGRLSKKKEKSLDILCASQSKSAHRVQVTIL